MTAVAPTDPYDALLVVSFGGPEKPDDVVPFLQNVTRGRGIPAERLAEVGSHYFARGGKSPINDQCRGLIDAVTEDFAANGIDLPVYWGNRNWDPMLSDTLAKLRADGVRRAAAFVTSAYSSYSGCRQYREDLYRAAAPLELPPEIDKLRHYYNHPGFVGSFVDSTVAALERLPADLRDGARVVFVTHSIPDSMAETAGRDGVGYVRQHQEVAHAVATRVDELTGTPRAWDLVYCSRSGPPQTPWLEPDVNDHLARLSADGSSAVVAVPIGFVSDHMEVVYDLDIEAAATAERLGLAFSRAATPGIHPAFVEMVRDLVVERAAVERGQHPARLVVGSLPPSWDVCRSDCCPNARGRQPALCETVGPHQEAG